MLAVARAAWANSDGKGLREIFPSITPPRFDSMVSSHFNMGAPAPRTPTRGPLNVNGSGNNDRSGNNDGSGNKQRSGNNDRSSGNNYSHTKPHSGGPGGGSPDSYWIELPELGRVLVHATRRPSAATVRTLKATVQALYKLYGPSKNVPLEVYLVANPAPKTHARVLTERNVNSGFTAFSRPARVVVFRCEEMHKVLVHELLHFWGTHSTDVPASAAEYAHRELGAPRNALVFEAYVEAVATLLMSCYCSDAPPETRVMAESRHSAKVAKYIISTTNETGRTNAWMYYVGKACLLADAPALLAWLMPVGRPRVRTLAGAAAYMSFIKLMERGMTKLGGSTLNAVSVSKRDMRMCECNLGPAFV